MTLKSSRVEEIGCLTDGFYGKVYKDHIKIMAPGNDVYCVLYKKSTPFAHARAEHIIACLNGAEDVEFVKRGREQQEKDATKLQFELADEITKLKERNKQLEEVTDKYRTQARRAAEQTAFFRNVTENQSVALRNMSASLEK